jgi:RNA-directed DNA polymerase
MDHMIYYQVWKWCVRKHPNKSKRWVKRKYFSSEGGFGPFSGLGKLSTGEIRRAKLLRLASIKIIRHVIVKGQANPYSSTWKSYFEQRQEIKWKIGPKNKGLLLQIWQKQKGCCPVCQQMIDLDGDRNKHHIQPRKEGGGDNLENLVLLHPTCHRQLHANEKVAHSVKSRLGVKRLERSAGKLASCVLRGVGGSNTIGVES